MNKRHEEVYSLSLRRGFIWPSSEIYGGAAGFYDYGPNGAELKRRWEDAWLDYFLGLDDNFHLIDTTTIAPYVALKSSGHVDHFSDILVRCRGCGADYKADGLIQELTGGAGEGLKPGDVDALIKDKKLRCPRCKGEFGSATEFNMMFPVAIGAEGNEKGFLRPETAQGAYLCFKRAFDVSRKKLPLGLASIGRAYRNEISPRQGVYRMRELIQAELQIFFDPSTFDAKVNFDAVKDYPIRVQFFKERGNVKDVKCAELVSKHDLPKFYVYHMAAVQRFYLERLNMPLESFRFSELGEAEKAFYNRLHFDIEVNLGTLDGFKELGGVHYRTDYDLANHQKGSKESMEVFFEGRRFVPHVLELSFGVDRNLWALMDVFYEKGDRTYLRFPPCVAPYLAGVFPLVNKDGVDDRAREIFASLREDFSVFWDDSGSIGKRYARMDEIGTPFCLTIDYDTLKDGTVTIRDRDSAQQKRLAASQLEHVLRALMLGRKKFPEL